MASAVTGGQVLNKSLADMANKLGDKRYQLKVGFLIDATYPDGTSVAMVAAIQEFGAPRAGIPARPFFRPMIKAKGPSWGPAIAKLLVTNKYDVKKVLGIAGVAIKGQLQASIISVHSPALSPVTLMLRSMKAKNPHLVINATVVQQARAKVAAGEVATGVSIKPLIDTGWMLSRVGVEVK